MTCGDCGMYESWVKLTDYHGEAYTLGWCKERGDLLNDRMVKEWCKPFGFYVRGRVRAELEKRISKVIVEEYEGSRLIKRTIKEVQGEEFLDESRKEKFREILDKVCSKEVL